MLSKRVRFETPGLSAYVQSLWTGLARGGRSTTLFKIVVPTDTLAFGGLPGFANQLLWHSHPFRGKGAAFAFATTLRRVLVPSLIWPVRGRGRTLRKRKQVESNAGIGNAGGQSRFQWLASVRVSLQRLDGLSDVSKCRPIGSKDLDQGDLAGYFLQPLNEIGLVSTHGIKRTTSHKIEGKSPPAHRLSHLKLCGSAAKQLERFISDRDTLLRIKDQFLGWLPRRVANFSG